MIVFLEVIRVGWPTDAYIMELNEEMPAIDAISTAARTLGEVLTDLHGDDMDEDDRYEAARTTMLRASVSPSWDLAYGDMPRFRGACCEDTLLREGTNGRFSLWHVSA